MSRKSRSISSHDGGERCAIDDRGPASPRNGQQLNEFSSKSIVAGHRYDSYRIPFYGSPAEKEAHRQQLRAKLKEQVKEKDELHHKQLIDRVAESDQAVALDQKNKLEDNESRLKKAAYLKQFSDENKKIMEEKEKAVRRRREAEAELERRLLNINPINWNMTLH